MIDLRRGRAAGLVDPPALHVGVDLRVPAGVKLLADVADALVVVERLAVEVLPPEVLVELCVVGVDDLEEVGQRFRVRKIGRVDVRVGRRDGRVVGASEDHC